MLCKQGCKWGKKGEKESCILLEEILLANWDIYLNIKIYEK